MADYPVRPPTPQTMVHRLPDKPDASLDATTKPSKFIILIVASTAVAGKVQVAKTVSAALSCPLFQGDSLHETAAKAATVGASKHAPSADERGSASGANETRYQRMWLSKMTRTGLLFPDESRAAGAGFSGFGGTSSTSTSRRGSASSEDAADFSSSDAASLASSIMSSGAPKFINKPPLATQSQNVQLRMANPALICLTHPELEKWHKDCIRRAVGEYSIGVIFVPLDELAEEDEEEDLPILKPLDPRTMTSFGSFDNLSVARQRDWGDEIVLKVNVAAMVEEIAEEIVDGARDIMNE